MRKKLVRFFENLALLERGMVVSEDMEEDLTAVGPYVAM